MRSTSALTSVVLPAPEGAAKTNRRAGLRSCLFDVLDLLAHLLDQHFEFDGGRVVSVSADFEPSVLASRLSSCIRKSRRRPTGFVAAR